MTDSPQWPHRFPVFRFLALAVSLTALFLFVRLWQHSTPVVPRYDLPAYIRTQIPVPFWHSYTVLEYGRELAVPSDPGAFTLHTRKYDRAKLAAWLRTNVYAGQPIWMVLKWPLVGAVLLLIVLLPLGGWLDDRINRGARQGTVLRGPTLISKWRWNWAIKKRERGLYVETR